jgi:peptidoglycan/xylan/chitin deacetylase (PgdA/CDA1 family)
MTERSDHLDHGSPATQSPLRRTAHREEPFVTEPNRPPVSRRSLITMVGGAVVGVAVSACSPGQDPAPAKTSPRPAPPATPHPSGSTPGTMHTPQPTPIPSTLSAPVKPRTAPVYKVHDIIPDAPANAIALTIDDGPVPDWTPRVLRVLEKYDVKATFCMIGAQAHGRPWLVRSIASEGHGLANHTYRHPMHLNHLSEWRIQNEIARASDAIYSATHVAPKLFRSPGGNWTPHLFKTVAQNGLIPIDWDVDPMDWSRPGTPHIVQTLLRAKPGDILLCHDGGGDRSETVAALQTVLPALKARGLQFVRL